MAKEKSFIEYMRDWRKKKPIKFRADGTVIDDFGNASGEIRSSEPDPLKRKGKKRETVHTRVKRVGEPRSGVLTYRNAAKRRKRVTVEI